MLNGIASIIFPTKDIDVDKAFWSAALNVEPYFDQPFYVGFKSDGRELGLDPDAASEGLPYPVSYWITEDLRASLAALIRAGASQNGAVRDVGEGVLLVTLTDPSGNIFGLLERPHG